MLYFVKLVFVIYMHILISDVLYFLTVFIIKKVLIVLN